MHAYCRPEWAYVMRVGFEREGKRWDGTGCWRREYKMWPDLRVRGLG